MISFTTSLDTALTPPRIFTLVPPRVLYALSTARVSAPRVSLPVSNTGAALLNAYGAMAIASAKLFWFARKISSAALRIRFEPAALVVIATALAVAARFAPDTRVFVAGVRSPVFMTARRASTPASGTAEVPPTITIWKDAEAVEFAWI